MQCNRMRSYSEAYGNILSAGVLGLGLATTESADINMVITTTPIRGTWFERLMRGKKKRTGRIRKNNFGLLGEALLMESTNNAPSNLKYNISMNVIVFTHHLA